jgi:hypothetical protein
MMRTHFRVQAGAIGLDRRAQGLTFIRALALLCNFLPQPAEPGPEAELFFRRQA